MKITITGHRPTCLRSEANNSEGNDVMHTGSPVRARPQDAQSTQVPLGFIKLKVQRHARQAALVEQAGSRARASARHAARFAAWDAWADEGAPGESRIAAVSMLKACAERNVRSPALELSGLGLTSLPELLPAGLKVLKANGNRLIRLPENLPEGLQLLDVSDNALDTLPLSLPASIKTLKVSGNRLTALPDRLPAALQSLDAAANRLRKLPQLLPEKLGKLDVHNNQLARLPDQLPRYLTELNADHNLLVCLPEPLPRKLEDLSIANNRLSHMPASLPPMLQYIDVTNNGLTELPAQLPPALQGLYANSNLLTSVPWELTAEHRPLCRIHVGGNPLSAGTARLLGALMQNRDYTGPRIIFPVPLRSNAGRLPPISHAAAYWHMPGQWLRVDAAWRGFQNEDGAGAFAEFLERLRRTVSYRTPAFRERVVEWLMHLEREPALRRKCFSASIGASETCEDRVALTYNDMTKARIAFDVENGKYDDRLKDLLALARGSFRLDILEQIARKKVSDLREAGQVTDVDDIEVYLAYQVKLRDELDLPLDVTDMAFFRVANVTDDDLAAALQEVREQERTTFLRYLSTDWQPWQEVLRRLHAKAYEAARERVLEATDSTFRERLDARLAELGLQGDADAEREVGRQVMNDIVHEINQTLTRDFLAKNNLLPLLS